MLTVLICRMRHECFASISSKLKELMKCFNNKDAFLICQIDQLGLLSSYSDQIKKRPEIQKNCNEYLELIFKQSNFVYIKCAKCSSSYIAIWRTTSKWKQCWWWRCWKGPHKPEDGSQFGLLDWLICGIFFIDIFMVSLFILKLFFNVYFCKI